jgi:hypothetical protein
MNLWGRLLVVAFCSGLVAGSSGCGQRAPAAVAGASADELIVRVKALEDLVPDQAHIMADVSEHFANLWFAGEAENWPLADFYLNETRSHLHWAVRRIPVRKDNQGHEIKLADILTAFENGMLTPLKGSIDGKNRVAFQETYRASLTGCYSCHKAADKPFLRPQVPAQPASPIVNFDPKATWPN